MKVKEDFIFFELKNNDEQMNKEFQSVEFANENDNRIESNSLDIIRIRTPSKDFLRSFRRPIELISSLTRRFHNQIKQLDQMTFSISMR